VSGCAFLRMNAMGVVVVVVVELALKT